MNRFREQRLKHGYKTQQELAKILYVNQTAISQWERGVTTPSPPILLRLSELYGVTTDYLLGRDESAEAEDSIKDNDENRLISYYRELNEEGKEKLLDYADDLVSSGKYKKTAENQLDKEA